MFLVDLNQDKSRKNKYLSNTLITKIDESLKAGKKVILYLNKRGDYSSLICSKCNFLYKCPNCDTSLSLHGDLMVCHICNFAKKVPSKCDNCNSNELQKVGVGTMQIEKSLNEIFNSNSIKTNNKIQKNEQMLLGQDIIFRFDTDVIKNNEDKKEALEKLKFTKIIIGTKMITTGFDFSNVGLIGVILLEQELQIPKYNTTEKFYSNIKQFLGRGGRKGEKTEIVVQTFIPKNEIVKTILFSNYKEFFSETLKERKDFNYPPFCEFVIIEYRDKDKEKALEFVKKLKEKLENSIYNTPIPKPLPPKTSLQIEEKGEPEIILNPNSLKKYNQYYYKITLKGENLKEFLNCIKDEIFRNSNLSVSFE